MYEVYKFAFWSSLVRHITCTSSMPSYTRITPMMLELCRTVHSIAAPRVVSHANKSLIGRLRLSQH